MKKGIRSFFELFEMFFEVKSSNKQFKTASKITILTERSTKITLI